MNKKLILAIAIAILTTGAIACALLSKQPKPVTGCDILLTKMLEAKTQDERDYAEKRWIEACVK